MRTRVLLAAALLSVYGFAADEIKRLSPVPMTSHIPTECQVASVMKGSAAEKAGIGVGDILQSVNGKSPQDASGFSDLVGAAPEDSEFKILKSSGLAENVRIRLSKARPRLGAVCDLSGWTKSGVTAAGNESITVFNGPYALTVSGIIDKGFVFIRVRIANESDQAVDISSSNFKVTDGSGAIMTGYSPKEVICRMYGEKGAHLLLLKKKHKESLDTHDTALLGAEAAADDKCPEAFAKAGSHKSDSEYAEANAKYLAEESLWPATYQSGHAADGLIYFSETSSLPISVQASLNGRDLSAQLAMPVASGNQMKMSELRTFFEAQKKGNTIRLTLKKGKVFVGRFSMYDAVEERAWFQNPSGGILGTVSYSVEVMRSAESLDQIPSKPAPDPGQLN